MGGAEFIHPRFGEDGVEANLERAPRQIVLPIAGSATRAFTPAFDGLGDRARFART